METKIFKGLLGLSLAILLLLVGVYWFQKSGSSEAAVKSSLYSGPAELDFSASDSSIREFIPPSKIETVKQDESNPDSDIEAVSEATEEKASPIKDEKKRETKENTEVIEPES